MNILRLQILYAPMQTDVEHTSTKAMTDLFQTQIAT